MYVYDNFLIIVTVPNILFNVVYQHSSHLTELPIGQGGNTL